MSAIQMHVGGCSLLAGLHTGPTGPLSWPSSPPQYLGIPLVDKCRRSHTLTESLGFY